MQFCSTFMQVIYTARIYSATDQHLKGHGVYRKSVFFGFYHIQVDFFRGVLCNSFVCKASEQKYSPGDLRSTRISLVQVKQVLIRFIIYQQVSFFHSRFKFKIWISMGNLTKTLINLVRRKRYGVPHDRCPGLKSIVTHWCGTIKWARFVAWLTSAWPAAIFKCLAVAWLCGCWCRTSISLLPFTFTCHM